MDKTPRAFSGKNWSRNAAKIGDKQPCVICGKAVTVADPYYVRVDTSNRIHRVSTELGNADFGCFPVGPECRKQFEIRVLAERV